MITELVVLIGYPVGNYNSNSSQGNFTNESLLGAILPLN